MRAVHQIFAGSLSPWDMVGLHILTWIYQSGEHKNRKHINISAQKKLKHGIVCTGVEIAEKRNRGWRARKKDKSQRGSSFTQLWKPFVEDEMTLCLYFGS